MRYPDIDRPLREQRYPDTDRLLREERFEELARLSAVPANRLLVRKGFRVRMLGWLRAGLTPARAAAPGPVVIRHADPSDRSAIARLSEMEDRVPLRGPALVAEVEQEILAAVPLDGSAPVAHPLRPTAGLIDLLELRSRQIAHDDRKAVRSAATANAHG